MRRTPLVLVSSLAIVAVLAGCSDSSTSSQTGSPSPSVTTAAAATSAPATSSAPAAVASAPATSGGAAAASVAPASAATSTSTGPVLPAGTALPTATGSYGQKPTLTFPTTTGPPTTLVTKILTQGTGPVVATGTLVFVDYYGQVWGGKEFDNSYDRKTPFGFKIGAGNVIAGWDTGLLGLKAGTRIMLSIPPAEGYGATGQAAAGITGTSTLVFVVDVISSYGKDAAGDPKAVTQTLPATDPQISGPLNAEPKITFPSTAPAPTKTTTTLVAKGSGPVVAAGTTLVLQYFVESWAGATVDSTRVDGAPISVTVGGTQASIFDNLEGQTVGSRVLIAIPTTTGQASASASPTTEPPVALVVDIVAAPKTSAETAAS